MQPHFCCQLFVPVAQEEQAVVTISFAVALVKPRRKEQQLTGIADGVLEVDPHASLPVTELCKPSMNRVV
jgi:hypothetical protein